jgi:hypothetical protein
MRENDHAFLHALVAIWPERLPAEAEESALTSHSSPPANDPPIGLHWQRT